MNKKFFQNRKAGFVILFAMAVSSIILAIALGVGNIAYRELRFSTSAKDTNEAFFAADTGLECALFNDRSGGNSFVQSGSSGTVSCRGTTISLSGSYPLWNFVLSRLGGSDQACAKVSVLKSGSTTTVISQGSNNGGSSNGVCNTTSSSTVRELELTVGDPGSSSTPPPPPPPSSSAIAFVRANGTGTGGSTSTTLDIGSSSNNRLVVVVAGVEGSTSLSGATVDGKACTFAGGATNPNGSANRTEIWYCDEDNLGASSGTVNISIQGGSASWAVEALLFTGVDQGGPDDIGTDTSSLTPTTTVTMSNMNVAAGGLVVAGIGNGQQNLSVSNWTSPLGTAFLISNSASTADLASGYGIEGTAVSGKTYQATWDFAPNRSSGVAASWSPATSSPPPPPPPTPISFRASAQASATSGNLVINKPSGTLQNDVMVTSIAIRPHTALITPPTGWNLIRRVDNSSGNTNSIATYSKVAGGSEPANYTWTLDTNTGSAGGTLSFSNVNTSAPVDVQNGQATPQGLSHSTPSVNTTVADTMVVTAHGFASSVPWSPPSGMTETVDVASSTGTLGISIEINYALQSSTGATGQKTGTAGSEDDVGNAQITVLKP